MIAIPRVRTQVNLAELRASKNGQEDLLSIRASLLIWMMLSIASWGVVFSGARIIIG